MIYARGIVIFIANRRRAGNRIALKKKKIGHGIISRETTKKETRARMHRKCRKSQDITGNRRKQTEIFARLEKKQ